MVGFRMEPDAVTRIVRTIGEAGEPLEAARNAYRPGTAAGESTGMLDIVLGHLETAASVLLADLDGDLTAIEECRDTYLHVDEEQALYLRLGPAACLLETSPVPEVQAP